MTTGAAGGIGQAISRQFVAGARVVAGDVDQAGLDKLEAQLNRTEQNVWSKAGDLRNKAYARI
ncbi:SDR family NAD(P)-dependent oxidoreductase [Mesorhizobium sp. M0012]|uniref:SDR family NAD(P)-dependent oxidoreductase n=1 Tax=Mesorhizobium sp. M0012 TaxID=2956840 RepID=UPI0033396C71